MIWQLADYYEYSELANPAVTYYGAQLKLNDQGHILNCHIGSIGAIT